MTQASTNQGEVMSGVDWNSDEAVVGAAEPKVRAVFKTGLGWRVEGLRDGGTILSYWETQPEAWGCARQHPTVVAWELAHNPAKRVGEVEAKARVLAVHPKAYSRKHIQEEATRTVTCWVIYTPQPGYEKDCVMLLSGGWDSTEDAAWLDAAAKLATPPESRYGHCPACAHGQNLDQGEGTHLLGTIEHPEAEEKVTWHVKSDDGFYEKFVEESSALAVWEMPYWKNRDSHIVRVVTTETAIATRKRGTNA